MVMVMLILTALLVAAAAYYSESEDALFTGASLSAYQIAASRAEQGAQLALAQIRAGVLRPSTLTTPCSDTLPFTTCANFLGGTTTLIDKGSALSLKEGGGLQYMFIVYKPTMAGDPTKTPSNLYTIRAVGYYGYSLTAQNLFVSEVEIQTDLGSGGTSSCANADDYGC
jgi:hypothetical protein